MISTAKTYAASQIEWLHIYLNTKKYTESQSGKILAETGGTFCLGGPIFLWDKSNPAKPVPKGPCCHLKVDGEVKCAPNYSVYGAAWNAPADYDLEKLPDGSVQNYLQCVTIVKDGKAVTPLTVNADMQYACARQVIGRKQGRFAYLVISGKYTPKQIQALIVSYGWEWAVLLDGGGSTCYADVDGGAIRCDSGRILYSYIVVKLKKAAPVLTANDVKRNKVLSVAEAEIGTKESPAGSNKTKYGKWFGLDGYAWCMMFVQWVMSHADLALPLTTASCTELASYAKAHRQWVTKDFKPGDILFMHWGKNSAETVHVGIVKQVCSTYVVTIEGNTSLTSQDNGGCVMQRNRAYANITGAYRPWYNM